MKKALVTGANGQDGSYLLELLIAKGYEVHGTIRRSSLLNTERIDHLMENKDIYHKTLFIHYGDVSDPVNVNQLIHDIKPDEIYNLAAQSHVKVSFELPHYTGQVDGLGTLNILDAVKTTCPKCKVYQASTSELYGGMGYNMPATGYTEQSPFHPRSPYGCAKLYAYWIVRNYREAYGMFACNGILFNHESPRRGDTFVTKKITNWFKKLPKIDQSPGAHYSSTIEVYSKDAERPSLSIEPLELGNLDAKRDWSHAKDCVEAMWLMLQHDKPEDFVIATNSCYSVREFINECLKQTGWDRFVYWTGEGLDERLMCGGQVLIKINPKYFRPSEVSVLLGDSSKARQELGWEPKYDFKGLIKDMLR